MSFNLSAERRIYNIVFLLFALIAVLPVWWFPGFLTADGPCHVYNAAVLKDFWTGNADFYKTFYTLNKDLEPNWFSHIALALLSAVFKPFVADKIVITLCVLLFSFGFRYFVDSFSHRPIYITLWIFIFAWQMAMFMGFYNYMLSLGAMFWIAGYWYRHHTTLTSRQAVLLCIGCLVTYFMHLLGIFIAAAIMSLTVLTSAQKSGWKATGKQLLTLAAIMLPAIVLILIYIAGNNGGFDNSYKAPLRDLWNNLKDIFSLQSIAPDEWKITKYLAYVFAALFLFAFLRAVVYYRRNAVWVMPFFMVVLMLLAYFFAYESMLGGSYIRYRLETLVYLFGLAFVAAVPMPRVARVSTVALAILFTLLYIPGRWQSYNDVNKVISEFRSLRPHIKDESLVLPLKYVDFLTNTEQRVIAQKVLLFSHVAEVAYEPGKKLIFLDNYEANTGYFPLQWQNQVNPFQHLAIGAGHESVPPEADITGYSKNHMPIDYIILWGRYGEIENHPKTRAMADSIDRHYQLIYQTAEYKIGLYKLKTL